MELPTRTADDHDTVISEAEDALDVKGWELDGSWTSVDTGYIAFVRRS